MNGQSSLTALGDDLLSSVALFGLAFATVILGLASSLPLIIICRSLAGVFSGNGAVLHSVLGEITDLTNQAVAFPIYGLFWPFGSILGPIFGGALANPAEHYPTLFHHSFWTKFPYFLPCFATGTVAFVVSIYASIHLKETLPSKRKRVEDEFPSLPSEPEFLRSESLECQPPNESLTMEQLLSLPAIWDLAISGATLSFTATAFDAVFVLFCYTPIDDGGLGFGASEIGLALAIAAASSILLQIIVLPPLLKTCSHGRLYYSCMFFWPVTFLAVPLLHYIIRNQEFSGASSLLPNRTSYILWLTILGTMVMSRIGCLAYSISLILTKQYSPSAEVLGKCNGVVLWGMCFSRAFAPVFVSSAFAWSIDNHILGGHLWLLIMMIVSSLGCVVSKRLAHPSQYSTRSEQSGINA